MQDKGVTIRPASEHDVADLVIIYNHYIQNTGITFETEPLTTSEFADRMRESNRESRPWLVAEDAGTLVGYAYASSWKGRCAYRYSVESTIYLDHRKTGKGVGSILYRALIDAIRARSMHTVIGGIALPNDASIRLHEQLGFRKVGHFERVGYKLGQHIDVGYWQLML